MKRYNGEKYIVSFTSFGPRIESACKMVFCLTKQKYKNFHLVMTLYKDDVKFIGPNMQALLDNGLLELIVADIDLGPHLKYFYAMNKYWDKPIITVDDDRTYDAETIGRLVMKHEELNYKSIISNCAIIMQKTNAGKLLPYPSWISHRLPKNAKSFLAMAEGFAGILYPPCAFKNLENEIPNILKCKYDDDLFLKTLHIKNGLPVTQTNYRLVGETVLNITEMMQYNLHNTHNTGNVNRVRMCDLFANDLLKAWDAEMKITVCSMTRHHNKADFIEWVKWYLNLGFDEFVIIDNDSDFSVKDCVDTEICDSRVKVKTLPGNAVYQNAEFRKHLNETDADWVLYVDDDEFLWFPPIWHDVHAFLETHIKRLPKDAEAISLYWKFVSSNEYIQNRKDTQLKTFHETFDYDNHSILDIKQRTLVKSFFKKSACKYKHENHFPVCKHTYDIFGRNISGHEFKDDLKFTDFYPCILHYYYKTADEWIRKHRRRSCSDANRIYPGSEKTDDALMAEYKKCITYFTKPLKL